jgi:hypothetical protein
MLRPKKVVAVPMGDVDSREIFRGRLDTVHDPPAVIGREAGVDQDRSRSPVISGTEVVGQVASRFAIAVTFPTVDLYGNSDMEIQQTRIPFHFPGIRNPVRQGTAVAGVSRARPE